MKKQTFEDKERRITREFKKLHKKKMKIIISLSIVIILALFLLGGALAGIVLNKEISIDKSLLDYLTKGTKETGNFKVCIYIIQPTKESEFEGKVIKSRIETNLVSCRIVKDGEQETAEKQIVESSIKQMRSLDETDFTYSYSELEIDTNETIEGEIRFNEK